MSYLAESAWSYIEQVVRPGNHGASRRFLFTIPALPRGTTLDLGITITRHCLAERFELIFKVADELWRRWVDETDDKGQRAALEDARSRGWFDETGALTHWRNQAAESSGKTIVVLCGADTVTDAGSLEDFHRCDLETIWAQQMRESFQPWVAPKLAEIGLEAGKREAAELDRLLKPLLEHGKADLIEMSWWLEQLDLSGARTLREVQLELLNRMGHFGLPRFAGFPLDHSRASLGTYIGKADEFFSYTMFLDERQRDKALKAIQLVREKGEEEGLHTELDSDEVRGPYRSWEHLLEGLEGYITEESASDREALLKCDFVTIVDKILKFRSRSTPVEKEPPLRRISGSPVEVVLYALWRTLRDFRRDRSTGDATLQGIRVEATKFKHDYDSAEADSVADRNDMAVEYLRRLTGGLNELIRERVDLPMPPSLERLDVECDLCPDGLACQYSKTAEPQLEFTVSLKHSNPTKPLVRRYAWRLPETQPYRLAEAMVQWSLQALDSDASPFRMPVFHLPYYDELLRASDDDETRRVMVHCLRDGRSEGARWTNLLSSSWLSADDVLLPGFKTLSSKYFRFLKAAGADGLHKALFASEWTELRQAYAEVYRKVTHDSGASQDSQMTPMLMRAFLVVAARDGEAWTSEKYEPSAVATALHPAVLEMLEAQIVFLFACFNAAAARELQRENARQAFSESIWAGYVDLSSIQAPLVGLLYNEDLNITTDVRGTDLIHRIGRSRNGAGVMSTRVLVRYDGGSEEEEVTDADMFRESRESKLLFRLLADYFRLHPHARDGLSLAVYRNQDIQPVIAAVHQYVTRLADRRDPHYYALTDERSRPYAISVTVFSDSGDEFQVGRWIDQWRERWEAAETENKLEQYRRCVLSVSHRIIEAGDHHSFAELIFQHFEADIAILYDFIGAGQGGNQFAPVSPFDATSCTLKFPILGKPCCAVQHPTDSGKRARVISNRQFSLGTLHAQLMHRIKNQGVQAGREFVVVGVGDFAPWRGVVGALHQKSEWVVCIDPSMDERLIRLPAGEAREREIIGFGSGVGSHGEANYTVSTEQFSLIDVCDRLSESMRQVYTSWSGDEALRAAKGLLAEAAELSGLSLVRATGVGEYVRDFMAYTLVRKMLRDDQDVLCDHLVSLDAYRHWFDLAENDRRPDLLWLTARTDEQKRISIEARLIECKVAGTAHAQEHLSRARAQINNGLRVLAHAFSPRAAGALEDNRPDQRYWWLQLQRLIASNSEVQKSREEDVLSALERLAEGDFSISWSAAVFAFLTDEPSETAQRIGEWSSAGQIQAEVFVVGSGLVKRVALQPDHASQTWEQWRMQSDQREGNVCDLLDDVELPPGEDEDADTPLWLDLEDVQPDENGNHDAEGHATATPEPPEPDTIGTPPPDDSVSGDSGQDHTVPTDEPTQRGDSPAPMVEVATRIPERVALGSTVGGGRTVYWEFGHPQLANRHMVVFGTSGMGKTYAIQCLLCELGRLNQNSLIVDYTDGFVPSKLENATERWLNPRQHFIRQDPLPISPFKAQVSHESGMTITDDPLAIARRVASIFKSVYVLGDQQFPVLIDAITDGVKAHGDDFTLEQMMEVLQSFVDDQVHSNTTVRTTMSKLRQFVLGRPFAKTDADISWSTIFSDQKSRCNVFQFHMVDRHSARAVIEFVLWDLYSFVTSSGNKDTPRVVVLDEVQNLDLGPDAPVAKYLTEGRKHGLALILATQTVKGVGGVSDARVSRMFQAEHKLFFKPTENEMREHAVLLHNAISTISVQEWVSRLASLRIGECWSLGRVLNEQTGQLSFQAQRIKISSLEERGFNA